MTVVADTNTLISAYLWSGKPAEVIELHACGWIELQTCEAQLAEFAEVLRRPKFAKRLRAAGLSVDYPVRHFTDLAHLVEPFPVGNIIIDDPDDNVILGCAKAANAQAIVSGDRHLLALKKFEGISVYRAAEFVALFDWTKNR